MISAYKSIGFALRIKLLCDTDLTIRTLNQFSLEQPTFSVTDERCSLETVHKIQISVLTPVGRQPLRPHL